MGDLDTPELASSSRFALVKRYLSLDKIKAVFTQSHANRGLERYRRAGITASSSFIAKALNILISFLSVPLTVHYLGAERYGVWLTISSLITWMSMTDFGLAGNALVNVLAETSGREDHQGAQQYSASAFWALSGISAVAGVLCLATFRLIPWRAVFRTSDVRDLEAIRRVAPFYANSLWGLVKSKILGKASDKNAYLNSLQAGLPGDVAAKVWFLGMFQRPELVDRYYASDIFAFAPIWDEGFGLPAVEAMATGLPVVTSRSGTLVETVVDGKTGILVEKNNPEELAEALLRLLNDADLREAMGRAGRQRVMGHFTWDRIAKGMHTRYTTLCAS